MTPRQDSHKGSFTTRAAVLTGVVTVALSGLAVLPGSGGAGAATRASTRTVDQAAKATKVDTFVLSGDLKGTLVLTPTDVGCGDAGYLEGMTGKISGIKLRKGGVWEMAINTMKKGTYKASDSLNSKAHVTLEPPTSNSIENTLTNVSGTLTVTGANASSGSVNLKMENVTGKDKATIKGSWSCPPPA
jgi:hypothetical protein